MTHGLTGLYIGLYCLRVLPVQCSAKQHLRTALATLLATLYKKELGKPTRGGWSE